MNQLRRTLQSVFSFIETQYVHCIDIMIYFGGNVSDFIDMLLDFLFDSLADQNVYLTLIFLVILIVILCL